MFGKRNIPVHMLHLTIWFCFWLLYTSVNRPLDFMFGIEKDWHFYWVNQFLETSKIPFSFVKSYGMMKFIRNSIDEGKYIELRLDQYYISDREEYRHRHFMLSLIHI